MKKQIPNILSFLRLCMIPIVAYFLNKDMRTAAWAVFALASATDVLDGYLARTFGWVTELGKILDPLADKLLQFTAAVCLALQNSMFWVLAGLVFLKELAMTLGGYIVLRRCKVQVVSLWFGKAATAIYFTAVSVFMLFPAIAPYDTLLLIFLCAVMVSTLALYYFKGFKGMYGMTLRK